MQESNQPAVPHSEQPADRAPWVAPELIPLDKIANAEKISFNTEGGNFSAIS